MAGRRCTVCAHLDLAAINQAMVNRQPFRRLAERFSLSKDALLRHHDDHLPALLAKAQEAAETAQADDLLAELVTLKRRVLTVLDKAEKGKDWRSCAALLREARGYVELLAEMAQQIGRRPTLNLLVAPEWLNVRTALLEALRPYPEARTAVAARLVALESQP